MQFLELVAIHGSLDLAVWEVGSPSPRAALAAMSGCPPYAAQRRPGASWTVSLAVGRPPPRQRECGVRVARRGRLVQRRALCHGLPLRPERRLTVGAVGDQRTDELRPRRQRRGEPISAGASSSPFRAGLSVSSSARVRAPAARAPKSLRAAFPQAAGPPSNLAMGPRREHAGVPFPGRPSSALEADRINSSLYVPDSLWPCGAAPGNTRKPVRPTRPTRTSPRARSHLWLVLAFARAALRQAAVDSEDSAHLPAARSVPADEPAAGRPVPK